MVLVNGWIYGFLEVELTKSKTVNILSSHIVFYLYSINMPVCNNIRIVSLIGFVEHLFSQTFGISVNLKNGLF